MRLATFFLGWFIVLSAPTVQALQWAVSIETPGATRITHRHIESFVTEFDLDRDRSEIARTLYDEFLASLREYDARMIRPAEARWQEILAPLATHVEMLERESRGGFEQVGAGGDGEEFREIYPRLRDAERLLNSQRIAREIELAAIADEQARMERTFVENLRALLNDDEEPGWPAFERQLDRDRYFPPDSAFPEVTLDLLAQLDALELTADDVVDREALDATRLDYEIVIDGPLDLLVGWKISQARRSARREREWLEALQPIVTYDEEGEVLSAEPIDLVEAMSIELSHRQGYLAEQRIREINRMFRPLFEGQLRIDAAEAFRENVESALLRPYWDPNYSKAFLFVEMLDEKQIVSAQEREVMQAWLDDLDRKRTQPARELLQLSNRHLDLLASFERTSEELDRLHRERLRLHYAGLQLDNDCVEGLWNQLTPQQHARVARPAPWTIWREASE